MMLIETHKCTQRFSPQTWRAPSSGCPLYHEGLCLPPCWKDPDSGRQQNKQRKTKSWISCHTCIIPSYCTATKQCNKDQHTHARPHTHIRTHAHTHTQAFWRSSSSNVRGHGEVGLGVPYLDAGHECVQLCLLQTSSLLYVLRDGRVCTHKGPQNGGLSCACKWKRHRNLRELYPILTLGWCRESSTRRSSPIGGQRNPS